MRKKSVILSFALVVAVLAASLSGCAPRLETDKQLTHYLYNGYQSKFVSTGATLTFFSDLTFGETYAHFDAEGNELAPYTLDGTYTFDPDTSTAFGYLMSDSYANFRSSYKKELKSAGYSDSEAELIVSSIATRPTYYSYRDYVFKLDALQAARSGSPDENLNTLEGVYNLSTGTTSSKTTTVKFKRGNIYYQESSDPESEYNQLGATYVVRGDFVEIKPNPDNKNNELDLPVSQKYLMATLTLPDLTASDVNNDIIDYGDPDDPQIAEIKKKMSFKKIRVLVLDFYSALKF